MHTKYIICIVLYCFVNKPFPHFRIAWESYLFFISLKREMIITSIVPLGMQMESSSYNFLYHTCILQTCGRCVHVHCINVIFNLLNCNYISLKFHASSFSSIICHYNIDNKIVYPSHNSFASKPPVRMQNK